MIFHKFSIVVACDKNGIIGDTSTNSIPFKFRSDLHRFKLITTGGVVLMGRKTFESIGRALPNRKNIVLSCDANWKRTQFKEVSWLPEFNGKIASNPDGKTEAFIIGGASLYNQALEMDIVSDVYITIIDGSFNGDVLFPVESMFSYKWERVSVTEGYDENKLDGKTYSNVFYWLKRTQFK